MSRSSARGSGGSHPNKKSALASELKEEKAVANACFTCGQSGHFRSSCPQRKSESRGKIQYQPRAKQFRGKEEPIKQVQTSPLLCVKGGDTPVTDSLDFLLSDSGEEDIKRIEVKDGGSCAKGVQVTVQGVPAVGLVDSGSDMSIVSAELFEKVATTAHLRKRDLKPVDKVPRT